MRLSSYSYKGQDSYGIVRGYGIVDLKKRVGNKYPDLLSILRADKLEEIVTPLSNTEADFEVNDIIFNRPVTFPEKIFCIGVNYANRNEEYKDDSELPNYPSVFVRTPDSLVGHENKIVRPPESPQLDYEGEIGLVIGKSGRRIKKEDVWDHLAGFTVINEGTIRDWLRHAKFNVTQGKNFAASGGIGPYMVTRDEVEDISNLSLETRVNGEVRQKDIVSNMIFGIEYIVPYLSTFMELKPGDIIATGTPPGAGTYFDPPKWLVPGDLVEVEVARVGILRNEVMDENVS
tara:strand:- start:153 stop:1019 length:867 start_codon:yes stop_codon:yes gene_type:complete